MKISYFFFALSYLLHTTALLHPQQVPQQPEHTATLLHTFHLLSYMYASHFVSECSATGYPEISSAPGAFVTSSPFSSRPCSLVFTQMAVSLR